MDCKMNEMERKEKALQERDYRGLFAGWFNNRMDVILMAIQCPRRKNPESILKINFFLEDIQHHFIDSHVSRSVWDACRYLRRFFKVYPDLEMKHCERAIQMVERIYDAVGLNLKYRISIVPNAFRFKRSPTINSRKFSDPNEEGKNGEDHHGQAK